MKCPQPKLIENPGVLGKNLGEFSLEVFEEGDIANLLKQIGRSRNINFLINLIISIFLTGIYFFICYSACYNLKILGYQPLDVGLYAIFIGAIVQKNTNGILWDELSGKGIYSVYSVAKSETEKLIDLILSYGLCIFLNTIKFFLIYICFTWKEFDSYSRNNFDHNWSSAICATLVILTFSVLFYIGLIGEPREVSINTADSIEFKVSNEIYLSTMNLIQSIKNKYDSIHDVSPIEFYAKDLCIKYSVGYMGTRISPIFLYAKNREEEYCFKMIQ